MTKEHKENCLQHFANFLGDYWVESLYENKLAIMSDALEDYLNGKAYEFEDEFETYDTMRDKTTEVEQFLRNFLAFDLRKKL